MVEKRDNAISLPREKLAFEHRQLKEKGFTYFDGFLLGDRFEKFGKIPKGIEVISWGEGTLRREKRGKSFNSKLYFLHDPQRIEFKKHEATSLSKLQEIAKNLLPEGWQARYGHDVIHGSQEKGYLRIWTLILFRPKPQS